MAYTQNEHINVDEELVVLRPMCLFYVFVKLKPGKIWYQRLWVAADAKSLCAYKMQVHKGKTD